MRMEYPKIILEDTRNQPGKHENIHAFCAENGIRIVRTKIVVGDYSLPTSQETIIDTKQDLGEVYNNLVQSHDRFARECDMAAQLGIHLVILVEDDEVDCLENVHKWSNPRMKRYMRLKVMHENGRFLGTKLPDKPPVSSKRLQTMMETFADHHGCEWMFCRKAQTGAKICEILMGEQT